MKVFQLTREKLRVKDFAEMKTLLDKYECIEAIIDAGLTI
jgi:hypothetical protein